METGTSIETRSTREFSPADYVVFTLLLCFNGVIGLYYAIKDRRGKNENTQEYLLGGKRQSVIPVALSLAVTYLSANTLLGTPVDMYYNNTMFIYSALAMLLVILISAWVFIPFFYRLGYTSTFQYLEDRFSPPVRTLGVFFMVCQMLLYMGFVLYAPCLALSAVTGLSFEGCIIGMGVVVTFYTALGGMKTVLWTDTFQSLMMFVGLLAIFIQGIRVGGGWSAVWGAAEQRGRIVLDEFSFEPSTRHSFFSVVIGGGSLWLSNFGVNQAQVQRCLSTSSIRKARISMLISAPVIIVLFLLCCFNGVLMFAFYADCDPVKFGVIGKKDQLLPLFMLDILGHVKGLPGLIVSSIFAGSLSTLSSGLNAVAAIVYDEFRSGTRIKLKLTEKGATIFTKIIAFLCGICIIGLAFLVSQLGTLQQASMTVYGILNGPIFGLFILGMFFPWANSIGAIVGFLVSVAFMSWIGIGAFVNKIRISSPLPTIDVGCNWPNGTTPVANINGSFVEPKVLEGVDHLYTLSYLYYTLVGMLTEVVVGLIVSFITGPTRPSDLDSKYVMPMYYLMQPPEFPDEVKPKDKKPSKSWFSKAYRRRRNQVSDANANNKDHHSHSDGQDTFVEMNIASTKDTIINEY